MSQSYESIEKLTSYLDGEPEFSQTGYRDTSTSTGRQRWRSLNKPNSAMRELHRRVIGVLDDFVSEQKLLRYAHGAIRGRSTKTNIGPHLKSRFFYLTDLRDAFGHVRSDTLGKIVARLTGWPSAETIELMQEYFCLPDDGGLVTGGPASSLLFNIYLNGMDELLADYCEKHEIIYTRFVDDLTFSSQNPISDGTRARIRSIITKHGFEIAHHKSTYADLQAGKTIRVTGINLSWHNGCVCISIPRRIRRNTRAALHQRSDSDLITSYRAKRKSRGLIVHMRDTIRFARTSTGRDPTPGEANMVWEFLFGK